MSDDNTGNSSGPDVSFTALEAEINSIVAPIKSPAIEAFLRERTRQVVVLGYTPEVDKYRADELIGAGNCYVNFATNSLLGIEQDPVPFDWPWSSEAWKPHPDNPWRDIEKGVALIAAGYDERMREEL